MVFYPGSCPTYIRIFTPFHSPNGRSLLMEWIAKERVLFGKTETEKRLFIRYSFTYGFYPGSCPTYKRIFTPYHSPNGRSLLMEWIAKERVLFGKTETEKRLFIRYVRAHLII